MKKAHGRTSRAVAYLLLAVVFGILAVAGQGQAGFLIFFAGAVFFELRFWIEVLRSMRRDPGARKKSGRSAA